MLKQLSHYFLLTAAVPLLWGASLASAHADEWEQSSPYYEDDAWYDISEWLDGNDYNPTDEVVGRWDDEIYDSSVASTDSDNDASSYTDSYGYDETDANDDWFYDYYSYDDGYYSGDSNEGFYSYTSRYYDYDDDGFYDAYSSYADTDADGLFEDYNYYSLNTDFDFDAENSTASTTASSNGSQSADAANQGSQQGQQQTSQQQASQQQTSQQRASQQKDLSSKRLSVAGTVERTKQVKVPKGPVRLVAEVKGENDQMLLVDLGPANQFGIHKGANQQESADAQSAGQNNANQQAGGQQAGPQVVKQGVKLVAHGPAIKVGDKKLILAQTVKVGDHDQREILRTGNTVSGTISKMKTAEIRGLNHQLAILDLESGKQALVDLGRKENLPTELAEGDQIEVTGIPTKVKDRLVFIANSISKDGDKTKIQRMTASAREQSTVSATR